MFSGVLTASHQFISGKLGEKLPEPCPELSPTIRVESRARLGVAAEAETGALAEANKVAKLTTDNKATFLTDAVEVEARALAEAGGKASLEADGAEAEEKAKIGAAQDDHGGGVHKSDIDVEVITRRGLPGSDLDSNRGVGGDVRRDGEGIPTRWELPRSESDPGEGAGRNGEEIPGSDTHYLQKGSLPRIVVRCDGWRRPLRLSFRILVPGPQSLQPLNNRKC